MKNKYLLHIGPGEDMLGGILSVIKDYMGSKYLDEYIQKHLVSVTNSHKIRQFLKCCFLLVCYLIKYKNIIVHIHMSERGSCIRAITFVNICRLFKKPIIIHSHGSEITEWYNASNICIRRVFVSSMKKASRVIVLTSGWKTFWREIVNEKNIEVIPNFVPLKEYKIKTYFKHHRLNVLFLGRIGERKGVYELVHAMEYLKKRNIKFALKIAGDGEIEKCRDLVQELRLDENVEVMGWISGREKLKELEDADCLVLPSKYESFGIVILEAMVNQLPCVCGDKGYTKEIIDDGIDGLIAKSGDSISIADCLEKFCDPVLIKQFGDCAYMKIKEKYSEKEVVSKLVKVYEQLLDYEMRD